MAALPARPRPTVLAAWALALAALAAAPADADALASRYEFVLLGAVGSPLWWAPASPVGDLDGTTRFDVGPLPTGVSVRVVAVAESPLATVQLYVLGPDRASYPPPAQDPLPAFAKSRTVAGPGLFVVLVDPGPGASYRLRATFDGAYGSFESGSPAPFALTARGTYRCPIGPQAACPP